MLVCEMAGYLWIPVVIISGVALIGKAQVARVDVAAGRDAVVLRLGWGRYVV